MDWIIGNAQILLQVVGGLVAVASVVARLTPTDKDDKIVGLIKKGLEYFSLGGLNKGLKK